MKTLIIVLYCAVIHLTIRCKLAVDESWAQRVKALPSRAS